MQALWFILIYIRAKKKPTEENRMTKFETAAYIQAAKS
jgi:hypothetical protein